MSIEIETNLLYPAVLPPTSNLSVHWEASQVSPRSQLILWNKSTFQYVYRKFLNIFLIGLGI